MALTPRASIAGAIMATISLGAPAEPADRATQLLQQMSLTEQIGLLHGASEPAATDEGQAGYWPGLPRLRIPALRLTDGPPGILTRRVSTGMPATMALAATFSVADAEADGRVIGRDARALGQDIVLEPYINMDRDRRFERSYNTYGEDPLLTGLIGAGVVRGVQSQGVMAEAKHFVAYEGPDDVRISPQALREIYAAPFEAASLAGVSSMMCAYNMVGGVRNCGNDLTLKRILRDEIGFTGFVTSDWGAVHASDYLAKGLDLEMPGALAPPLDRTLPSYFEAAAPEAAPPKPGPVLVFTMPGPLPEERITPPLPPELAAPPLLGPVTTLTDALKDGTVHEADVTRAAHRILAEIDRFGWLDHPPDHTIHAEPVEADAIDIARIATDAAVLLKNDDGALPLKADDLASLVLIGPGAGQTIAIGQSGEKALGRIDRQIGTVAALGEIVPEGRSAHIQYEPADDMTGEPVPAAALSHDGKPGLSRTSAADATATTDPVLDFTHSNESALPPGTSAAWSGTLTVPEAGRYVIAVQVLGAGAEIDLDGGGANRTSGLFLHGNVLQPGQDNVLPTTDGLDNLRTARILSAGPHALRIAVAADQSGAPVQVRLAWTTPAAAQEHIDKAVAAAAHAHTAIVFAWSRGYPDFALPGDQDRLIAEVAAANPRTIVVLNVSQPVAMPWLDHVKSVLNLWYPGDEGGPVTAQLLLGRSTPAGRLPFTWPATANQGAVGDPAHPERVNPDSDGRTSFTEGIYMGYRGFDRDRTRPLYPFGYGLSYTHFAYRDLAVSASADGGLDVAARVRNDGDRAGDEVPQVYLGPPSPTPKGAEFAVEALAGFTRLSLQPGEERQVAIHLAPRALQYWSAARNGWVRATGTRTVAIGASSRDLRLLAKTVIR